MTTATVICDCGEKFRGTGPGDFEAITSANRQRTLCREADPHMHKCCREARAAGYSITASAHLHQTEKASV